jgi:hypothetical protein
MERQVSQDLTASLGYSGSHSNNIVVGGGNTGNTSYGVDLNLIPGDLVQHPAFDSSGVWTGSGIQTRLNHSFGGITYAYNGARQNYSAFIAAMKGRFAKRGFLTASYTYSSSKDNSNNYPSGYTATGGTSYNIDQWYSPSPWDVPNRFSLGWSYDLPGLKGRGGFADRLTSGWALGGTTVLQSGTPFYVYNDNQMALVDTANVTVTADNYASELAAGHFAFAANSGNYAADGLNHNLPNALSYKQKHDRKSYQYTGVVDSGIISHAQFANPDFKATGTEGSQKINQFRNPGFAQTDLTVKKTTNIFERLSFELRLDTFNLFNRVNLNDLGSHANWGDASANFGTINSNLQPRNMQVAARFVF